MNDEKLRRIFYYNRETDRVHYNSNGKPMPFGKVFVKDGDKKVLVEEIRVYQLLTGMRMRRKRI